MATIVTRAGKGSALTFTEADANFTNLNNDLVQAQADIDATEIVANAAIPKSIADAKGDLIVATAADTVVRLPTAADGKVLTTKASEASGLSWETPTATAANVSNTPAGGIAATTAQAAIDELDTEKAPKASPTFSGTITTPLTASRAVVTGASSELAVSATTATELGYVNGVTSALQTQLNAKAALASPALTGTPTAPTAAPGTNSTQLATTAYADAAASAAASPSGGYLRNRIINGDMRIDQRYAGASTAFPSGYGVDRWQFHDGGTGAFTFQRLSTGTPPTDFSHYVRCTVTTADTPAAAEYYFIRQPIEGTNLSDMNFGLATARTFTVSFWVRSSLTGTFSIGVQNGAANRSYAANYTISAANTWEQKTVTIAGDTTGTWVTDIGVGLYLTFSLGMGTDYQGAAGAWAATNDVAVTGETQVSATLSATWDITGVQLEPGTLATTYERESYTIQFAKCQRYYETGGAGGVCIWSGNTTSGSIYYHSQNFNVNKRAAGGTGTATSIGVSGFAGAPAAPTCGVQGFYTNNTSNATASGSYFQYSWTASAEL